MNRTALIATTLFAIGTAGAAINDPVRLDTGMISGATTTTPDVRAFKGIPYAAPPVGDLRWRAPQAGRALGRNSRRRSVRPRVHAGRQSENE